jgi:hypothetical protein
LLLVMNFMRSSPRWRADPALRAVTATGLMTVGVIHALEIQGQLSGAAWLTIGFALLAGVAPLAGIWLLIQPSAASWTLAGLVSLSAALGYMLTRAIAVPGDLGDRGNWLEPLGLAALIIEWIVVILTSLALSRPQATAQRVPASIGAENQETSA